MNLFRSKPVLLQMLLLFQPHPEPARPQNHFQYQRAVNLPPSSSAARSMNQACAILDANIFSHAAPALKDLRLYSGLIEIPFSITISEPSQQDTDDARILNLRAEPNRIVFDLEMPHRHYTAIVLDLAPHDFIATATVSGGTFPDDRKATPLGTFTLFDLTSQRLSRSLTIPLSESAFPYLHLELSFIPAPGSASSSVSLNAPETLKSITVPPSREAQSLYATILQASMPLNQDRESVYTFNLPTRVPVERIRFALPAVYRLDFSRSVTVEARSQFAGESIDGTTSKPEATTAAIFKVHRFEAGHDLSAENLNVPVAIGSNMQQPALVEIHVNNGQEAPLPLTVALQMRQRRVCFDATLATGPLMLYYGDPSLEAPNYKDASLNLALATPRIAILAPETTNTDFVSARPVLKFAGHRPILRWIALLGCVCVFALLVIRSTHRRRR